MFQSTDAGNIAVMMVVKLTHRFLTEVDLRLYGKFLWNFGWKGRMAVSQFEKRLRRGEFFPAFVFISPTNQCNLRCQGCWVTPTDPPEHMDPAMFRRILDEARANGSSFFGILGGEPLMYPGLFDLLADYPDCYFQVFTNGTLLTDKVAAEMRRLGNITPLVSVEGLGASGDARRGGVNVCEAAMAGIERCRRHRLITGVATSVCASNFDDLVSETFIHDLIRRGVLYLWYYIYRPVGPRPTPELALSEDQVVALREFIVDQRTRAPIMLVDAYWDHEGRALCPAAVGISHHVNPCGEIEVCPPIQFARDNVADEGGLTKAFAESAFLSDFRHTTAARTRGCILLEDPAALRTFMEEHGARDTGGRGDGFDALAGMRPCPSHHLPGREIPERSWMYRIAKRNWFFGFGAYG